MKHLAIGLVAAAIIACSPGPTLAAGCKHWDVSGSFVLPLNDGTIITGNIRQSGDSFGGRARSSSRKHGVKSDSGALVDGGFGGNGPNGTPANFSIEWQLRGKTFYEGMINASGAFDAGVGPVRGTFLRHARCVS